MNYKRFLILHNLGIPIDARYANIFDKMSEYLEYVKKVKIYDNDNDENICYIGKDDKIIFSIYTFIEDNTKQLIFHRTYDAFVVSVLGGTEEIDNTIIDMLQIFIQSKGIEVERIHFCFTDSERSSSYINSLKKRYKSDNYEKLELENS